MRILVINNTSAGPYDTDLYDLIRAMSHDGDELVMRTTGGETRAENFIYDAEEFDLIIIAGGDGTASSVCYALRGRDVPTLILPVGTANLLALNLDSPIDIHAFADVARRSETLDFDLGELEFDGRKVGFFMIAGAGYDATIMENAAKLKATLGENAYFTAALANQNPTVSHFTITADGVEHEIDGIAILLINFGRMQFDITMTPENDPRDGKLEVVVIKVQNAMQLVPTILSALFNREGNFPADTSNLEVLEAREVHVVADPPLTIQYDGEPTGQTTPLTARALPGAIQLVVDMNSPRIQHLASLGRSDRNDDIAGA